MQEEKKGLLMHLYHLYDLAIPIPQDCEHAVHGDHSPQPPFKTISTFISSQLPLMHLVKMFPVAKNVLTK